MNATHFIEQVNIDGFTKMLSVQPISKLEESKRISNKFNVNTIAFFKIYPKVKPLIAQYDYDLKTTIIE